MKKSDLENGMILEDREGTKYILIKDFTKKTISNSKSNNILLDINFGGYDSLNNYNDNLTNIGFKKLDIMKIYCLISCGSNKEDLKLLWEREKKNKVEDVFDYLSSMYRGTTVTMKSGTNGYNFYVYVLGNKRARAFIGKQKLEKTRFEEVINILVKQLDESILLAFRL